MSDQVLANHLTIEKRGIEPALFPKEQFYYYTLPDFDEGRVIHTTAGRDIGSNKFLVPSSALLISKLNPRIKRVWLVKNDEKLRSVSSTEFVVVIPKDETDSGYLYYILQSDDVYQRLESEAIGTTNSHVRYKPDSLLRIRAQFPSFQLQSKIGQILQTIDQYIEKTEALIEKYQQIKTGLMHDLFTRGIGADGKLRPLREQAPELYQETPIGWMPKEWGVKRISGLCSQIADCPHSTPIYRNAGIPCIRTADMKPGKLLLEQAYCVDEKDYKLRTQRLRPSSGDIIYSREGERLGIASPVGEEMVCLGQRVMILRPASDVDSSFLLWAMNHPEFYRRVTRGLGATTSPHVNVGDIQRIQAPAPTSEEQVVIGNRLGAVQARIDNEEKLKRKLQHKKSGLMHDLLTGKVQVNVDKTKAAHV